VSDSALDMVVSWTLIGETGSCTTLLKNRRDLVLRDRGEEGSSPEVVLGRRRRWFGLAAVALSSKRWLTVRAFLSGSLMVVIGRTGSSYLGEDPHTTGKAWGRWFGAVVG
jgi:hypothetical protein